MKSESSRSQKLLFLSNKTPMQASISDHNVFINQNVLFFNMMMRGFWNAEKTRYNNGFGVQETINNYQDRIKNIVRVLAESVALNPQIDVIGLAEAPIKENDINIFIKELEKYTSLDRFKGTVQSSMFTSMGVATFFDSDRYFITNIQQNNDDLQPSLQNRIQEFILKSKINHQQVRLFNLHLPYDIAKSKDNVSLIRFAKKLFESHQQIPVVVIGDFNINPTLIANKLSNVSVYIPQKSNLLIESNQDGSLTGYKLDTVDGVLRSMVLDDPLMHNHVDATDLPWYGTNPFKEIKMANNLFASRYNFFNKRLPALRVMESETMASSGSVANKVTLRQLCEPCVNHHPNI